MSVIFTIFKTQQSMSVLLVIMPAISATFQIA